MRRTKCLGALALMVFLVAAGTLPGVIGHLPYRWIGDEGRGDAIRFGPFSPDGFESLSGAVVGANGELALELTGGLYARSGVAQLAWVSPGSSFDTVHVGIDETTAAGAEALMQVRVVEQGSGQVSRWQVAGRETELLLARPASALQIRVVLTSATGRDTPRVRGVIIEPSIRRPVIEDGSSGTAASVPMPEMVTRAMWGARPPKDAYTPHEPHLIVVHHSYQPDHASYQGASTIRGIQNFHMDERGWSDIGYHFLIGPDGKVYQGRPDDVVGAHSPPNTNKVGVCCIGNFNDGYDTITPIQRETLVRVLAHLAGKWKIPTTGIHGHREFQTTDCPGNRLFADLPNIRDEVGKLVAQAAGSTPGGTQGNR